MMEKSVKSLYFCTLKIGVMPDWIIILVLAFHYFNKITKRLKRNVIWYFFFSLNLSLICLVVKVNNSLLDSWNSNDKFENLKVGTVEKCVQKSTFEKKKKKVWRVPYNIKKNNGFFWLKKRLFLQIHKWCNLKFQSYRLCYDLMLESDVGINERICDKDEIAVGCFL